jgi:CRISPR-associated endonuclease/helicase Cas3
VDRRVVVDQATDEAEQIVDKLAAAELSSGLQLVRGTLQRCRCAPCADALTISTLRGQFADNQLWYFDPSRAAVAIGTVDMIGSRLLFSGYGGLGRYRRSSHAGLLAQDALVVFDEAHLTPAFAETLEAIDQKIKRAPCLRPFHVMFLSATLPPSAHENGRGVFKLSEADMSDPQVRARLNAKKTMQFIEPSEDTSRLTQAERWELQAERMCEEALRLAAGGGSVAILVSTVKMVNEVTARLRERLSSELGARVLAVTGEMRGKERDDLVGHPVLAAFAPFRHRQPGGVPAFLVATSCVEVGFNFDADHAVCDLVSIERMIQRLGRVNRFGEGNAQIRIVLHRPLHPFLRESDPAVRSTFAVLSRLPKVGRNLRDASPKALMVMRQRGELPADAFEPAPPCPPLDEARLDDWAMTSLSADDYPKPQVSYWLRGVVADQTLYTWFCWRADLDYAVSGTDAAEMARAVPVSPREVAQVNTLARGADLVKKVAQQHGQAWVVILSAGGAWRAGRLAEIANDERLVSQLAFATVYLPAALGGLLGGCPDISAEAFRKPVVDAVDENDWIRLVLKDTDKGTEASRLLASGGLERVGLFASSRRAIGDLCRSLQARLVHISGDEKEALGDIQPVGTKESGSSLSPRIAYLQRRTAQGHTGVEADLASLAGGKVPLCTHLETARAVATRLTSSLDLPPELADAVVRACEWHDAGKKRPWWQAAIGNADAQPLAKSDEPAFDHDLNGGYRHEFGSFLDAMDDPALAKHPRRDLILHLIAAHHGWARPTFEPSAYDRSRATPVCERVAREATARFARLQREQGWWQLAYLEALVKCADAIASANPRWPEP